MVKEVIVLAVPDKRRTEHHTIFRELDTGRIALPKYRQRKDRLIIRGEVWRANVLYEDEKYLFVEPFKLEPPSFIELALSHDCARPPLPSIAFHWKVSWWACTNCEGPLFASYVLYTPLVVALKPKSECFITSGGSMKVWWEGIAREVELEAPHEVLEDFVERFQVAKERRKE